MPDSQRIFLARHGQTEWALALRHTGRTDIPLTPQGEINAAALGRTLQPHTFARVFSSPSIRARRTCELAGYGPVAVIDDDLQEWDYGNYEGLTSPQIRRVNPAWDLFTEGCPGGESPRDIAHRADCAIVRLRASPGDVLLFSSAHFLRVLAVRWLGLEPFAARYLVLSTASLSILGYEHPDNRDAAILLWNQIP